MDKQMVARFMAVKDALRTRLQRKHPETYRDLVKLLATLMARDGECPLDAKRVHKIDDGSYQGTLVFVVGEKGYQPSNYWYVLVSYGSCSGCDTLEKIRGYGALDKPPSAKQVRDYMTLALHIVQRMRPMAEPVG